MNIWFIWAGDLNGYKTQFDYHPANYLIFSPFFYLFKDNPIPYNYIGFAAKIIASFVIGFLAMAITRQKKAFWIATVLYASYFGSQESYVFTTARNNVVNLILVSLTIIFYIQAFYKRSQKLFFTSLVFLVLSFLADPIRMLFMPILLIVFDFIQTVKDKQFKLKQFLAKFLVILIVSFLALFSTVFGRQIFFPGQQIEQGYVGKAFNQVEDYDVYFIGVGNLITSYFNFSFAGVKYFGDLIKNSHLVGSVFVLLLIMFGLWSVLGKKQLTTGIFISGGILGFLFINWLAFTYIIPTAEHRYQVVSSAFFVVFLTYWMIKIKSRKKLIFLLLFLTILNLFFANQINQDWDTIRNYQKVQGLINKQLTMVMPEDNPQMFVLVGGNRIVSEQFGWSFAGTVPYAFKHNLIDRNQIPSFAPTLEQNYQIFCNELGKRPVIADWIPQNEKMDITNVFGFKINDFGQIEDYTDTARLDILGNSKCTQKIKGQEISSGISVDYYISSNKLRIPGRVGVYIRWKVDKVEVDKLKIKYTSEQTIVGNRVFEIVPSKLDQDFFEHIIFLEGKDDKISLLANAEYCPDKVCTVSKNVEYNFSF